VHISERPLVFIPLALAGEANAPLAALACDSPQAAARAADPVRCPPAGPATDPTFDNEVLDARLLAVRTAKATGGGPTMRRAKAALTGALTTQLEPTWTLMWRAVELLRGLPPGDHVATRWAQDRLHLARGPPP
jgi:hypothetical protein